LLVVVDRGLGALNHGNVSENDEDAVILSSKQTRLHEWDDLCMIDLTYYLDLEDGDDGPKTDHSTLTVRIEVD
jgi:hypothetical protein